MPVTTTRFFIVVGVLLLILVVLGWAGEQVMERYEDNDPSYNRAYWEQVVRMQGTERAYTLFKERNEAAPRNRQHFSAHVIGMTLFDAEGVGGLAACDDHFGFGCYHGFFSRAVAQEGTKVVRGLDDVCRDTYGILGTGCQHGIGHGILEHLGYDRVPEALALCETETTQVTKLLGCTSGVFMGYLLPLTGEGDALEPGVRAMNPDNPYEPCTEVLENYQDSCYFELGQWFSQTKPDAHALCGALKGSARMHCFLGAGSESVRVSRSADTALSVCAPLGPDDELACRAGAMWGLFSTGYAHLAPLACAYTDTVQQSACVLLADLTEGQGQNFPQ